MTTKTKKPVRFERLELIARDMVGDCKTPNLFFVSQYNDTHDGLPRRRTLFLQAIEHSKMGIEFLSLPKI